MINFRLRSLFLLLLLLVFSFFSLHAQRSVGVKWEMPQDEQTAINQLQQYSELGISIIEVQSTLSPAIWQEINRLEFEIFGNLGIIFPTTTTFSDPDSSLISSIEKKASAYLSQSSVTAIGLFEYGAVHQTSFLMGIQPFAEQLKSRRQVNVYFTSRRMIEQDTLSFDYILWDAFVTPQNIDSLATPQSSAIGGYLFSPSKDLAEYLTPFKKFLEHTSASSEKPILLHQDWLNNTLEKHSEFSKTLRSITSKREAVFPLPEESLPNSRQSLLPIMILLLIWGTVAWHFNSSPLYRKSLFRYFTAHSFFIQDVYQRHIRSSLPALLIILQNVLLLSACIYATSLALLSPLGEEALLYHFPIVTIFGNNLLSIFAWSVGLILLISIISIIWLYLTHKKIKSLTQTATIYAWPLQLNIILGTTVIALFSAGANQTLIAIFTILAVLIFIFSFFLASLDTARFARSKIQHHLKTSGIYILLWGGVAGLVMLNPQWLDIISLSLNLK